MKHWQETRDVVHRMVQASVGGATAAVATVVRISGSAYRGPGAKLLVTSEGETCGGVSGGCLEDDVREIGKAAMRDSKPVLRRYDTGAGGDSVWGLGLGCEGMVEVFIQPVRLDALEHWQRVGQLLDGEKAFALCTVLSGPYAGGGIVVEHDAAGQSTGSAELDARIVERARASLASGASRIETIVETDVFIDAMRPPPWFLAVGAGDDAIPLLHLASTLGFRTAVIDHRPAYLTAERFPGADRHILARFDDEVADAPLGSDTYAVVMTHSLASDHGWVKRLLGSDAPYVGMLGPRKRARELLDQLDSSSAARVFGPVGLDVGADGPEQIAVAVLAEVLAVRASRRPQHLRDREVAIHAG